MEGAGANEEVVEKVEEGANEEGVEKADLEGEGASAQGSGASVASAGAIVQKLCSDRVTIVHCSNDAWPAPPELICIAKKYNPESVVELERSHEDMLKDAKRWW